MPRTVLMRDDGGERIATEAELLTEQRLHDVLTEHPELIPAEDLGMGPTVVVGRESGLEAGRADLVLLDAMGRLCLVEVKKEGNPDTRKVVAQLIDYASSLWQMSVEEFERTVFHTYLRAVNGPDFEPPGLLDHLAATLNPDDSDAPDALDAGMDLEQTLRSGRFRLVLAAPTIPPGVQRNIEYMNDQGMLLYGLEVNYFAGDTECFVPRLVVKPRAAELARSPTTRSPARLPPATEASFLPQLEDQIASRLANLLHDCQAAGARVEWLADGPRIRSQRRREAALATFYVRQVSITIEPPTDYPARPFQTAAEAIAPIATATPKYNGAVLAVRYAHLSDDELDSLFGTILMLAQAVALPVDFSILDPAIEVHFVRNDNNIWVKAAPALEPHAGCWLRGRLTAGLEGDAYPVTLEPLARAQPGWRPPRFESAEVARTVWPPNQFDGDYRLTVEQIGSPVPEAKTDLKDASA